MASHELACIRTPFQFNLKGKIYMLTPSLKREKIMLEMGLDIHDDSDRTLFRELEKQVLTHNAFKPEAFVDPNVQSVIDSYQERAKQGFLKYGTDTTRDDIDLMGWLQHLQEELMDATIYIERLKQEIKDE